MSCILKIVALFNHSILGKQFSESLVGGNFMSHLKAGGEEKVLPILKYAGSS